MRNAIWISGCVLVMTLAGLVQPAQAGTLAQRAVRALSDDRVEAQHSIAVLRGAGPAGLEALFDEHADLIASRGESNPELWTRLRSAIDAVAAQHDAHATRLYWYTDLEEAKSAARQSGRPIISLRMLGNLTEEMSCANSRYFRATLYTNDQIARRLRENFVLHWHSVRPVPTVTIDFGDGRVIERTVTGNSVHLVLDCEGRPIEALPGLYGPQAFERHLERFERLAAYLDRQDASARDQALRAYHARCGQEILKAWQRDLTSLGFLKPLGLRKGEAPTLDPVQFVRLTDDTVWGGIAQLHAGDAQLDDASRAYIASLNPTAAVAGAAAVTKAKVENPILRLVRGVEQTIAIDSVRNEYDLHRKLHDWFAQSQVTSATPLAELSDRIYSDIFLTPNHDPWLGLFPAGSYTGLAGDGVVSDRVARQ